MKKRVGTVLLLVCGAIALAACLYEKSGHDAETPPPETVLPEQSSPPYPAEHGGDAEKILRLYSCGELTELTLADYLPHVLAGEMPADFHPEALRAQAVAARTYLLCKQSGGCRTHPEADVCDDPACCTAYRTDVQLMERWGDAYAENMEKMTQAVRETDGLYLAYAGEPIQAVFHSASSGTTEDSANVWKPLPYLVCVDSPETASDVPNYVTEVSVSAEALRDAVLSAHPAADFSGGPETWLGSIYTGESGRVTYITLGGAALSGTEARMLLKLRSTCFTVEYTDDAFLFRVTGFGHGVGMSQYGANVMAGNGAGYTEILAHYYPGTELVSIQ